VLVVGLAPAANGGNRTGRVFTGDRSGDWLYAALHRAGFANQPASTAVGDGLVLTDAYVTTIVRCAPPDNKPSIVERDIAASGLPAASSRCCRLFRVIVALGGFAWDGVLLAARALDHAIPKPKPKFGHGATAQVGP